MKRYPCFERRTDHPAGVRRAAPALNCRVRRILRIARPALAMICLHFGSATRAWAQTVALGTTALVEGPAAGADSVVLAVSPVTHRWTATANDSWLHLSATSESGAGGANVIFTFDANAGSTRVGELEVAGRTLSVTQAGATYLEASQLTRLASFGFDNPDGLAVDGAGHVFIADWFNNAVRVWTATDGGVSTLVSSGLTNPGGVAVDGDGNLYVADTGDNAVRKWSATVGVVSTLVSAGLKQPNGLAVDAAGDLYIADTGNQAIEKWTAADGSLTTLVSTGLSQPNGVAVDRAGNVYIADSGSGEVLKWTATDGKVSALVATSVLSPVAVAVDGAGNVYIADTGNNSIEKWTAATGVVTTLVSSQLYGPEGVAVDRAGNLFIADAVDNVVDELSRAFVDPTPLMETAAAGNGVVPAVLPASANLAGLLSPTSDQPWLTITGVTNGVVSFAFTENATAARTAHVTLLGTPIAITQSGRFTAALSASSLAEGPASGSDSVLLTLSSATGPWTATANDRWLHLRAAHESGVGGAKVFFTFDAHAGPPRSGTLTIAGQTLTVTQFGRNSLGATERVEGPEAGVDSVALVFWGTSGSWTAVANDTWLHLDPSSRIGEGSTPVAFGFDANPGPTRKGTLTVAGQTLGVTQAGAPYVRWGAIATLVSSNSPPSLSGPAALAVDGAGDVYVADTGNHSIKKWNSATGGIATLVSSNAATPLNWPVALAVDGEGNVYMADQGDNTVKEWSPDTGSLTTLVGVGLVGPTALAADASGNLFISDNGAPWQDGGLKKWDAATRALTTLVGAWAFISGPGDIAVDGAGNLYIADNGANAVKKWTVATGRLATLAGFELGGIGSVAVDGAGNIYFSGNHSEVIAGWTVSKRPVSRWTVSKWTAATGVVATLWDSATTAAKSVRVDRAGNIFIVDSFGDSVQEVLSAFVDPTAKVETAAAGNDVLPMVLPAMTSLGAAFIPASDQDWLTITGVADGVVNYSFSANATPAPRTAHITLLGQSISVIQEAAIPGIAVLSVPIFLPDGNFQFNVTGTPGSFYSVLFSTNVALPLSDWMAVGTAANTTPGHYQFTDKPPAGTPAGFYRVTTR